MLKTLADKLVAKFNALLGAAEPSQAARGSYQVLYQGQSVDDLIIQFMEKHQIPGMAVAIVQAPYIPRVVGYGLADTTTKRLVASNTMFPVGQMTTAFTAVAIMQLVESGKLNLDDPISVHLPTVPAAWQHITIRELMTSSSGLPSYTAATGFSYHQAYAPEAIINLVKDLPLLFQPGMQVAHSGTDFYLLGLIIERASGMTYQAYVTQNQFERVGLQHTCFTSTLNRLKNEVNNGTTPFQHSLFKNDPNYINPTEPATGYAEVNEQLVAVGAHHESATFAYAGVLASAQDISIWDIGLAGDIFIKDQQNRNFLYNAIKLKTGQVVPANVGWQFPGHPGLMYIKGHVPGFSAYLSRFTAPTELVCVTLLANKDNVPDLDLLGREIAGAYDVKLAAPTGAAWTNVRQSPYSVPETLDRFAAELQRKGAHVFVRIDHSANATQAGEKLNPMQVIIFGNPAKGTALLRAQNALGLDLPLRAMAWQDDSGQVWLALTDPMKLAEEYNVAGQDKLLQQMYLALSAIAQKATSA